MLSFRNLPIRRKLTLVILFTSASALLLAIGAIAIYEVMRFRHSLVRELAIEAEIVAANSAAALAFSDDHAGNEYLDALKAQPGIVRACLFKVNGEILAEFKKENSSPLRPEPPGHRFEDNAVYVFRQVVFNGENVGTIGMRCDLREQTARLKASASIAIVALLAALFVALILSLKLQNLISAPVLELAAVAHQVTVDQNYSLRASKRSEDEIGQLIEEFNQMLSQVEKSHLDLRASEERLRQIAENINEVFWITDTGGQQVIYVSPAYETLWGRSCATVYSEPQTWVKAIDPADRERVMHARTKLDMGEYDETYRVVRPDGAIRWIHDRGFPVRDQNGKIYRIAGIAEDITQRKEVEAALEQVQAEYRRTEQLYRRAITGAGAVPYAYDYKTKSYLFMGEGIEKLLGYSHHEVRPEFWETIKQESILVGETAGMTVQEAGEKVAAGEVKNWQCDILVLTRDGKSRWISDVAVQNLDESGQLIGTLGILQDITERKEAEKRSGAFSSLASRLSAATTPKEAASNILDTAAKLIGWDSAFVHLYDRNHDRILPILTFDRVEGEQQAVPVLSFPRDPSPMTRWIVEKGALLIDQKNRPSIPFKLVPFGNKSRSSTSMIYVPIRQGDVTIGVLSIQRYGSSDYGKEDLDLLQALADHCSGTLQRIQMTEQLREAEAKYRGIFEDSTSGIFQSTPAGRYLSVNPALVAMFGYGSAEEMIANVKDLENETYVLPEKRRELKWLLESQGSIDGFEAERIRRDGSKFWIRIIARAVRNSKGEILFYEGTNLDITARRRLEKQLIEISDREQSRMGQDLHDGLCQHLVRTAFAMNLLEKDLAETDIPTEQVKKVSKLVDDAITQSRNLARGLYPVKLEMEGFHSAMQELAANIQTAYHLECDFQAADSVAITDHAVATHLYRIAQEATINAVKHAKSTRIQIRLQPIGDKIQLTISDDGEGISTSRITSDGMGLQIMSYRAGMIGASLKIEPHPHEGTIVTCIFEHKHGIENPVTQPSNGHS